MELFLQGLGHRTQVAGSVQQALDLATTSDGKIDLLLSDVRLPDGNGWELLRRLEQAGRRPKQAIAISAWGSETDVAESKRVGFLAHLVKPIAAQVLEELLVQTAEMVYPKTQ